VAARIAKQLCGGQRTLVDFNDDKDGHAAVLALFDKALAA
jgi:hypothetical protein